MKLTLFQQLKQYFDKEKIRSNKRLLFYAFFVAVAAIFWFLNALSKEYTTTLTYPVNYVDFPDEKVLTNKLPAHLTLKVRAYGFNLLRYKLSTSFRPITFDVNSYTDRRIERSNDTRFVLSTSKVKDKISRQLSSEISLLEILPDTIMFKFLQITHRKVPIKANLKLEFEKQYMLGGEIVLSPDSVTISGPSVLVDSVSEISTQEAEFEDLDRTTKRNVYLEKIEELKYSFKKVVVSVPVEQFTEAEKNVIIQVENLPDSLQIKVFPNTVKVSYMVGLSNYKIIKEDNFRVTADYKTIDNVSDNTLKVRLVKIPEQVKNVRFYPQSVEYIIERKNDFMYK